MLILATNSHAEQSVEKDSLSINNIKKMEAELNVLREEIKNLNEQITQSSQRNKKDSSEFKANLSTFQKYNSEKNNKSN